ncbi:carbohydrate kinase, YjeF related protein [Beutenbergia cavernae DSM 12333]|uniref:Bifunctional NAD(P)H-hydrate repair enzyme n=1 Tax=Beutenbergia cavernae (strain ATCC BAA-8 / DSM 12333 / CCUG 43141 / JCM 11478 / NBRC 16432 / NCIMB 13614 / HKI 0122) TaxID=471853 RepID=C5BZY8_BEUC1|nr:carbohydrate kinase, YjeF related protein [Beutenbergia cavernae DSM 12333]
MRAYSAAQVRRAEEPLLAAGAPLMQEAAGALARAVREEIRAGTPERGTSAAGSRPTAPVTRGRVAGARVCVLVGSGNNGGDGLFAAAFLAGRGVACDVVLVGTHPHAGGLAAARRAGVGIHLAGDDDGVSVAVRLALRSHVVVDAITGIGARGPLRGPAAGLVTALGDAVDAAPAPPVVVAVDVPSGIGVDDGAVPGPVLVADRTVTMGAAKPGLLLPPAAGAAGRVEVVELGLDALAAEPPDAVRLTGADVADLWPVPTADDHKYTRGVLGVVAGSGAYPGAAVLTTSGAVRCGVGMVRYLGSTPVTAAVQARHPEVVAGRGRVQAWVLGPGIDPADGARAEDVERTFEDALRAGVPMVLDAGALPLLPDGLPAHAVLTPHAGELARLLTDAGDDASRADVEGAPVAALRRAVEITGATVLLKGATTLVAGPGTPVYAQADATPWLATAGAGDVLAGVLGALLAGRSGDVVERPALAAELAAAAALVHGRAARAASAGGPIAALDVADAVPGTLRDLLTGEMMDG